MTASAPLGIVVAELAEDDRALLRRCLVAAADGPFFDDAEFATLFGLDRSELRAVIASWPNVDGTHENTRLAINNTLVNLIGYPHGRRALVESMTGATAETLEALLQRCRASAS